MLVGNGLGLANSIRSSSIITFLSLFLPSHRSIPDNGDYDFAVFFSPFLGLTYQSFCEPEYKTMTGREVRKYAEIDFKCCLSWRSRKCLKWGRIEFYDFFSENFRLYFWIDIRMYYIILSTGQSNFVPLFLSFFSRSIGDHLFLRFSSGVQSMATLRIFFCFFLLQYVVSKDPSSYFNFCINSFSFLFLSIAFRLLWCLDKKFSWKTYYGNNFFF